MRSLSEYDWDIDNNSNDNIINSKCTDEESTTANNVNKKENAQLVAKLLDTPEINTDDNCDNPK